MPVKVMSFRWCRARSTCCDASRATRPGAAISKFKIAVACGLWSPHINGLAVPIWSPQYQTFVVITIGLLSAMYDEQRLHAEVAPLMLELGRSLGSLLEGAEGDVFNNRISRKPVAMAVHNNNKPINSEGVNELEAGTRRARPARSLRAGDGRR